MKKMGILVIAVVIALAIAGVGYAAWSQTLDITGSANVAHFDVHFDTPVSSDTTGSSKVTIGGPGLYTFGVTMDGGYPGYSATVTYNIVNNSSVPVKLTSFQYSPDNGTTPWADWTGASKAIIAGSTTHDVTIANVGTGVTPGPAAGADLAVGNNTYTLTLSVDAAVPNPYAGATQAFFLRFQTDQNAP